MPKKITYLRKTCSRSLSVFIYLFILVRGRGDYSVYIDQNALKILLINVCIVQWSARAFQNKPKINK